MSDCLISEFALQLLTAAEVTGVLSRPVEITLDGGHVGLVFHHSCTTDNSSPEKSVGPFVDFGLGEYSSVNETVGNETVDGTVNGKALHEWLLLGAKFTIFP